MNTVQKNNMVHADLLTAMNGTKNNSPTVEDARDRFLKLLVTQIKNQDPLNPLDNA